MKPVNLVVRNHVETQVQLACLTATEAGNCFTFVEQRMLAVGNRVDEVSRSVLRQIRWPK